MSLSVRLAAVLVAALALAGCQSTPSAPLPLAEDVDLERFAGDWYVIGGILTPFERDAHDAVETYRYVPPDVMETTFAFDRGLAGERVRYTPKGFVRPGTGNAVWGMQFVWPFRADYRIVRLADDYSLTVIGRRARDYVWVMAREPHLADGRWEEIVAWLGTIGYDTGEVRRVPQSDRGD